MVHARPFTARGDPASGQWSYPYALVNSHETRNCTEVGGPVDPGNGRTPHARVSGPSLVVVDSRNEIRQFLASRRARITPKQVGLPAYGDNRRAPGLRREEVALLAGVSVDYYTASNGGTSTGSPKACWTHSPARCTLTKPSAHTCSTWPVPRRPRLARGAPRSSRSGRACNASSTR